MLLPLVQEEYIYNNTRIYERAYERDSHKHANTRIYERAYETQKYGIL
jgi:hypothetical protein